MQVQELIHSMADRVGAQSVYGDPISADGKTVVPVAKVRYGFGGGSGKRQGEQEGGGGGGGFVAKPVGYIEFTSSGTRYVPIFDFQSLALGLAAAVGLGLLLGRKW